MTEKVRKIRETKVVFATILVDLSKTFDCISSGKQTFLGQLYTIPSQTKTFIPVIPIFNHLFPLKMDITGMKVLV